MKSKLKQVLMWSCVAAVAAAEEPTVYLQETFDDYTAGKAPGGALLRRAAQVTVEDGAGKVGSGNVAHYNDNSTEGGALEYIAGAAGLKNMMIEFDLLNVSPGDAGGSSPVIFSVGTWDSAKGMQLNSNAKRAFGLEFYQTGTSDTLVLRVGKSSVQRSTYDMTVPQHVKIWVNDRDQDAFSYKRPDTGESALLNPDSFVVWLNGKLIGKEPEFGYPMQKSVTEGDGVLGRLGFGSTSTGTADFMIDNLYVEDPTGEAVMAPPEQKAALSSEETTPVRMPGAETMSYRDGTNAMNLFVYKPEGWTAADKRPALVYFFGGGWTKGTPEKSASWAAWAASMGMVGVAPDYRTKNRFGTSPLESVADGRAAFNWVVEHAAELGIDPSKIAVGGASAGGHVAMWTAIAGTPPGSDPAESPKVKPAGIFLSSAVTDTSEATGYTPSRFGENAKALSPVDQLDPKMPPVLMFHAADDTLVGYSTAVALHDKLIAAGNECELITVPQGGHGYTSAFPEWKDKVRTKFEQFLKNIQLLPVSP